MAERSEIQWGTTTLQFLIRRSARRATVALTIENDGKLVVTAPSDVPVDQLNAIVRRKAPWIVARIKRASDLPPAPAEREFIDGETVLYQGRQLRLKVLEQAEQAYPRMWAGWYEVPIPPGLHAVARRQEVRRRLVGSLREHAGLYLPGQLAAVCRSLRIEEPAILVREQKEAVG